MTKAEREKPDLINGQRRARIASGAGVTVTDVNQLMKRYGEARKMMKKMMPAVTDQPARGKKGKKGKKQRRPLLPGMPGGGLGGMNMSDLKKIQDLMKGE